MNDLQTIINKSCCIKSIFETFYLLLLTHYFHNLTNRYSIIDLNLQFVHIPR